MYLWNFASNAGPSSSLQGLVSLLPATVLWGHNVVGSPMQELQITQQKVAIELWHGRSSPQLYTIGPEKVYYKHTSYILRTCMYTIVQMFTTLRQMQHT